MSMKLNSTSRKDHTHPGTQHDSKSQAFIPPNIDTFASPLIIWIKTEIYQSQSLTYYTHHRWFFRQNSAVPSDFLSSLKKALQVGASVILSMSQGDVAQLGERDNRTVEVRGSSPLISTTPSAHMPCKSQTSMV